MAGYTQALQNLREEIQNTDVVQEAAKANTTINPRGFMPSPSRGMSVDVSAQQSYQPIDFTRSAMQSISQARGRLEQKLSEINKESAESAANSGGGLAGGFLTRRTQIKNEEELAAQEAAAAQEAQRASETAAREQSVSGGANSNRASGDGSGASYTPTGDEQQRIRSGMIERGIPDHIADGFMLNIRDESAFNPTAVGDGGAAYGLIQWNGPRKRALFAFTGTNTPSIEQQLDFLKYELENSEKAAWERIQNTTTVGAAAAAIVNHFERPAESHRARREAQYLGA